MAVGSLTSKSVAVTLLSDKVSQTLELRKMTGVSQ